MAAVAGRSGMAAVAGRSGMAAVAESRQQQQLHAFCRANVTRQFNSSQITITHAAHC
jgi:hypothetical protein